MCIAFMYLKYTLINTMVPFKGDCELVIEAMIDDLSPEQRHTPAGVMKTAKRKIYNLAIMDQLTHL